MESTGDLHKRCWMFFYQSVANPMSLSRSLMQLSTWELPGWAVAGKQCIAIVTDVTELSALLYDCDYVTMIITSTPFGSWRGKYVLGKAYLSVPPWSVRLCVCVSVLGLLLQRQGWKQERNVVQISATISFCGTCVSDSVWYVTNGWLIFAAHVFTRLTCVKHTGSSKCHNQVVKRHKQVVKCWACQKIVHQQISSEIPQYAFTSHALLGDVPFAMKTFDAEFRLALHLLWERIVVF